jgi:hypothetical protein
MDQSLNSRQGRRKLSTKEEPLSTRLGMLKEALKSSRHYPTVYVVVENVTQISHLHALLAHLCQDEIEINEHLAVLPGSCIQFGTAEGVERYRGTIPVFYDPVRYRRAA